ncbi:MAG: hypothetical protein ABJA82_00540 [Myxococcales bacterium]
MPKMGSSLLYPGRGTTAIGISDSTAAGRALLTAASAAAQRAALGISDVTEEASNELVHANTVCAFTLPSVLVTFPALAKPGAAGSAWAQTAGSGTAAITRVASGIRGGALQLTTGASGGEIDLAAGPVADAAFGGSFVDDLVAATSKWHVEYVAKITSTPGATTEWGLGWISPPGLIGPMMGVRGAQSTAKFRMFQGNTATGVNSTINIDTNWHRFRMWANGDTLIYFSVDNETPVTLSTTWGAAASPFAWLVQASSSQTVLLAGARYRVDGVVQ